MLEIKIPEREFYNEETNTFTRYESRTLRLEHSLFSLSKWEMKWKKPFLSKLPKHEKTVEEITDYIGCMCIDEVDDDTLKTLPPETLKQIEEYIEDPMTATTFPESIDPPSRSIDTAEIIYYWMVELGIPFECEHWPLNKLMTLIRVCSIKKEEASGGKKRSKRDIMARNRALNEQRRAKNKTKG